MSIFLTEHAGDCEAGGAVYFIVDDVDKLYAEVRAQGIRPAEAPSDTEWNAREMTIIDPDGNRLRFSTEVTAHGT